MGLNVSSDHSDDRNRISQMLLFHILVCITIEPVAPHKLCDFFFLEGVPQYRYN